MILRFPFFLFAFVFLCTGSVSLLSNAQERTPIVVQEKSISNPVKVTPVRGRIKPLFWEAEIGKSMLFIPLKEVEFSSVQNYKVVSSVLQEGRDLITEKTEALHVRELTISTKSHNFIRIYHIGKLKKSETEPGNQLSALKGLEEEIEKLRDPKTVEGQRYPVKHYPDTTHKHMVEYRVSSESDIEKLYASLQQAMIDFHAYELVDKQKPDTITKVKASENQ